MKVARRPAPKKAAPPPKPEPPAEVATRRIVRCRECGSANVKVRARPYFECGRCTDSDGYPTTFKDLATEKVWIRPEA